MDHNGKEIMANTVDFAYNRKWRGMKLLPEGGFVYAIAFDLDTKALEKVYGGDSWQNAYNVIRKSFEKYGFNWQQGSVYFGNENVDSVDCVLAVMELVETLEWFAPSVKDIRMLRIDEESDLKRAIEKQKGVSFEDLAKMA